MTGYGKSMAELPGRSITIEIRSLNSKALDINLRAPSVYREKELEYRSLISQKLGRGKIDITITIESTDDKPVTMLNKNLALHYYAQLKDLATSIPEAGQSDLLSILVRMPEVLKSEKEELTEEDWTVISQATVRALEEVEKFRLAEGAELDRDFRLRIKRILGLLEDISPFEGSRIEIIRARYKAQLKEFFQENNYDENRLEQEMIYFLEKLDITEEKTRLKQHCDYFITTLDAKEAPGKKLGFIAQEIGREVNTLGSKANDASIQKIVVQMKDELEKIKEQLANIL
jgi:uncharacterized protein (TIGR00255 family)